MPSTATLRALLEAARSAAWATARRREAAGLAKKSEDLLQSELFPPPEVVGGVSIPAPRIPRAGEPSFVVPASPGPPPMPAPSGALPLSPAIRRALPRAPRQLDLPGIPRPVRTGGEQAIRHGVEAMGLPSELGTVAENVIRQVVSQIRRRYPADVGRWLKPGGRGAESAAVERTLSPEDLRQEALRLIQARLQKLPPSPAALGRYLYPRVHRAAMWQLQGMIQPMRLPKPERRILMLEDRIRQARLRDPRFAALASTRGVSPGEIFVRLAKDPGFASLLRKEGGKRYFGTRSGVERTLEAGSPKAAREAKPGVWMKPGKAGRPVAETLTGGPSPLDELLAKAGAAEEFTGPMARMELALRALTEKQREVVTRVLGLGRPAEGFREIARELKVEPSTVFRNYHAGLKKLKAATAQLHRHALEAPAPPAPTPAPRPTAKELVERRLQEARRRIEARRRWEVEAPIRRMREKPPARDKPRPRTWGEAIIPTGKGKGPQ